MFSDNENAKRNKFDFDSEHTLFSLCYPRLKNQEVKKIAPKFK